MRCREGALALVCVSALAATQMILAAEPFELSWPVACKQGDTCWIANYVDVDATKDAKDFRCRSRTYGGHDGVDIAIRDLGVMREGVAVLASAAGTVRNVRDGLDDVPVTDVASRARIKSMECGNGMVMQHEGGWETQYCHLRKGSVRVKAGEHLERGVPLGLVGLSGKTEFPHVHLTVRHEGVVIDPFTGQAKDKGCGVAGSALWRTDQLVSYEEAALYNAGFSSGAPNLEAIRRGERGEVVTSQSLALVLWVDILGVRAGDAVHMTITGPNEQQVFEQHQMIDRTQARRFVYAGTKRQTTPWPAGTYTGQITLKRNEDGQVAEHHLSRTATISNDGAR